MTPYYEQDGIVIYHGDCLDILPTLGMVDHVITDPPYSEHVHSKSRQGCRPLTGSVSGGSFSSPANFNREKVFGFEAIDQETRLACGQEVGMSGGHFNYDQHKCGDMADAIRDWMKDNQDWLSPEATARLRTAIDTLTRAGKMAHRVDWFISCDDGEDSFIERWDEEGLPR